MTDLVYLTPTEAAELCRYSSGGTFLRAFRAAGFKTVGRRGKTLIKPEDLRSFLDGNDAQSVALDNN